MSKIAIVTSEGGMACAYSVGAMLALAEKYDLTNPDIVIGSSGSTGTLAYFVAKQYAGVRNIWSNLLSTPKFVSKSRLGKIMDIDYLIDEVFKKQEPLNIAAIRESKTQLYISGTNIDSGEAKYFSNFDDIFEALRASSAIPFYYGRKVMIGSERFVDGALSASIRRNLQKAKELGAEKIIVIDNSNNSWGANIFLYFYSWIYPHLKIDYSKNIPHDSNVLVVRPSRKLPVNRAIDNNQQRLIETIKMGYDDMVTNKELKGFLSQ